MPIHTEDKKAAIGPICSELLDRAQTKHGVIAAVALRRRTRSGITSLT